MIPNQLQNPEFRFCLVRTKSKLPFEKGWQDKGYSFNDQTLIAHINSGGNYGVIGGYGNLVIVDFDNQEFQDKMLPKMPKTFAVKTGSGKLHLYYICDKPSNRKILNDKKETLADIQGDKKQVIAPNSLHPSGNKYAVEWNLPIAEIPFSELIALFSEYLPQEKVTRTELSNGGKELTDQIRQKLMVADILSEYFGIDTHKNPTMCPFHNSNGGKCLSFTNEVWHCFHCEQSGDIFTLIEKKENCSFKQALTILAKKVGLENQLSTSRQFHSGNGRGIEVFQACAMAEDILEDFHIVTLRDNFEMFYYKDGIYHPEAEALIGEQAKRRVNEIKIHELNEVLHHIRYSTLKNRSDIGKDKYKIHLENGIFDLAGMKLLPFTPDDISLSKLPIKYLAGADCPTFKKFVAEIVKKEDIPLIQEIFGYSLWRDYNIQKAFMFIGEGRNGKSTLLAVLKRFLGSENICSVSLQELEGRFATAYFYNKMANIYADIPNRALTNTGKFKMLTGGDTLMAEVKGKMGFLYTNYAKMVFSCNQLPEVNDDTIAFFRRWIIMNFPNIFEDESADIHLLEKLTTDEEISGIFNWAIDGLIRILDKRKLSYNIKAEELGDIYKKMADSLFAFVTDCLEQSPDGEITKAELYETYVQYCSKLNLPIKSRNSVSQNIVKHIPVSETRNTKERCWLGVKLKTINPMTTIPHENLKNYENNGIVVTNDALKVPSAINYDTNTTISLHSKVKYNTILPTDMESSGMVVIPQETIGCLPKTFSPDQIRQWILDFMSNGEMIEYPELEYYFSKIKAAATDEDLLLFSAVFEELKQKGEIFEPKPENYKRLIK